MKWTSIFKGTGGEYEANRFVGTIGAISYIACANGFVGYEVLIKGREFDLTAYCLSFPTGLGVAIGAIAGAVAIKDRNVAKAKTETAAAAVVQADAEGRT